MRRYTMLTDGMWSTLIRIKATGADMRLGDLIATW
jgi:hypothetical protein